MQGRPMDEDRARIHNCPRRSPRPRWWKKRNRNTGISRIKGAKGSLKILHETTKTEAARESGEMTAIGIRISPYPPCEKRTASPQPPESHHSKPGDIHKPEYLIARVISFWRANPPCPSPASRHV